MYDAVVYSKDNCPWCVKAIDLLEKNAFSVQVLKLGVDYTKEELVEKVGWTKKPLTVPQIFIDDQLIGGYDHLNSYFSMAEAMGC